MEMRCIRQESAMRIPGATLDGIAALVAAAEHGDKAKAAGELGISISALEKRLKALSDVVGTRLLQNIDERITLSEAGQIYYPEAIQTIEHALLAEEKTRAHLLLRENLLLVGHSTYLAPRLLALVRQLTFDRPSPVRVDHRSGLTADIVNRVVAGTLHAGFGYLPVSRPGLLVRQLFEEPLVACLPADHPLAQRTQVHPEDFYQERFVAVSRESMPAFHEEIAMHFAGFGVELRVVADAFSPREALAYVEQKVGVCLLALSSITPERGIVVRPLSTRYCRPGHRDRGYCEAGCSGPRP
jgi:DNA-binding transcriptional LysR family regulator